jgi:hypothetical protein
VIARHRVPAQGQAEKSDAIRGSVSQEAWVKSKLALSRGRVNFAVMPLF